MFFLIGPEEPTLSATAAQKARSVTSAATPGHANHPQKNNVPSVELALARSLGSRGGGQKSEGLFFQRSTNGRNCANGKGSAANDSAAETILKPWRGLFPKISIKIRSRSTRYKNNTT